MKDERESAMDQLTGVQLRNSELEECIKSLHERSVHPSQVPSIRQLVQHIWEAAQCDGSEVDQPSDLTELENKAFVLEERLTSGKIRLIGSEAMECGAMSTQGELKNMDLKVDKEGPSIQDSLQVCISNTVIQLRQQLTALKMEATFLVEDFKGSLGVQLPMAVQVLESRMKHCESQFNLEREEWMRVCGQLEARSALNGVREQRALSSVEEVINGSNLSTDRDALMQATQEKVSLLLLLSQQEERHLLERKSVAVLELRISELTQRLDQATKEKVDALLALADLQAQLKQETGSARERSGTVHASSPRVRYMVPSASQAAVKSGLHAQNVKGFLHPNWWNFKGLTPASEGKVHGSDVFTRLHVDHSALTEALEGLNQFSQRLKRMRLKLQNGLQVKKGHETETMLEALAEEARNAKTALDGSALPISWSSDSQDEGVEALGQINDVCQMTSSELLDMFLLCVSLGKRVVDC